MGWMLLMVVIGLVAWYRLHRRRARRAWVANYRFPSPVTVALLKEYPQLKAHQAEQVLAALRSYFQLCQGAGKTPLGMPSQVVDKAWHAFILCTRDYQAFCQQAFGRYLHHTPHQAGEGRQQQRALRQTWLRACRAEGLVSTGQLVMPTLFALDAALGIPHGFQYRFWPQGQRQESSFSDSASSTIWLTSDGWFGDDGPGSSDDCSTSSDDSSDSCSDGGGDSGGCSGGGCSGGGGD